MDVGVGGETLGALRLRTNGERNVVRFGNTRIGRRSETQAVAEGGGEGEGEGDSTRHCSECSGNKWQEEVAVSI